MPLDSDETRDDGGGNLDPESIPLARSSTSSSSLAVLSASCKGCHQARKQVAKLTLAVQLSLTLASFVLPFTVLLLARPLDLVQPPLSLTCPSTSTSAKADDGCQESVGAQCIGSNKGPAVPKVREPLLGSDPFGWVPAFVGAQLGWRNLRRGVPVGSDAASGHTMKIIDSHVFDSVENMQAALARLDDVLGNETHVATQGRTAVYKHTDGSVSRLPPDYYLGSAPIIANSGSKDAGNTTASMSQSLEPKPVYGIRAFVQVSCIRILVEHIGYGLANRRNEFENAGVPLSGSGSGSEAQAPPFVMENQDRAQVLADCLGELTDAVVCAADAQPISKRRGELGGDGELRWCRDFEGLRRWAEGRVGRAREVVRYGY